MKKNKHPSRQESEDILRDILIVQLAVAGLTKHQIRETVGVDMNRITKVTKYIKKGTRHE